jgi:tmRNA-binding protein
LSRTTLLLLEKKTTETLIKKIFNHGLSIKKLLVISDKNNNKIKIPLMFLRGN